MRRAARKDANQSAIVKQLRQIPGLRVEITNQRGIPDLLVAYKRRNYLFETKVKKGKLTPAQQEFFDYWPGQASVIRTIEDCLKELGIET